MGTVGVAVDVFAAGVSVAGSAAVADAPSVGVNTLAPVPVTSVCDCAVAVSRVTAVAGGWMAPEPVDAVRLAPVR